MDESTAIEPSVPEIDGFEALSRLDDRREYESADDWPDVYDYVGLALGPEWADDARVALGPDPLDREGAGR